MKTETKKLVLRKQTLKTLTTRQLDATRGGGFYNDSNITCDMGCVWWSYFTR